MARQAQRAPPALWRRLKPNARTFRHEPTNAEAMLWEQLRNRKLQNFRFRRQHAIDRFVVDFYCAEAKLVIEVDGPVHDGQTEHDAARDDHLRRLGLTVLRVRNEDVDNALDNVIARIRQHLPGRTP